MINKIHLVVNIDSKKNINFYSTNPTCKLPMFPLEYYVSFRIYRIMSTPKYNATFHFIRSRKLLCKYCNGHNSNLLHTMRTNINFIQKAFLHCMYTMQTHLFRLWLNVDGISSLLNQKYLRYTS